MPSSYLGVATNGEQLARRMTLRRTARTGLPCPGKILRRRGGQTAAHLGTFGVCVCVSVCVCVCLCLADNLRMTICVGLLSVIICNFTKIPQSCKGTPLSCHAPFGEARQVSLQGRTRGRHIQNSNAESLFHRSQVWDGMWVGGRTPLTRSPRQREPRTWVHHKVPPVGLLGSVLRLYKISATWQRGPVPPSQWGPRS